MDYRPYILAGSFLLFVVAAITFLVAVSRARRHPHVHGHAAQSETASVPSKPLDTSLEGLELIVEADAPSASLLTPLRESEWVPPEEPAPLKDLPDVSLASRIARFEPGPTVPEPAFTIPQYPAWQVPAPDASTETPLSETLPHVRPQDAHDEFGAEIAALLPALDDESAPGYEQVVESSELEAAPPGAPAVPAASPETTAAPAPPVDSRADVLAAGAPSDDEVPAESFISAEEAPVAVPEPEPQTWVAAVIEEGPVAPRAEAVAREQVADRPAVSVRRDVAPTQERHVVGPVPRPAVPRPPVRVHDEVAAETGVEHRGAHAAPVATVAQPAGSREEAGAVDIRLAAPVEMWFGDHRVGVKQGSATFDRFLKYADALLDDLKDATRTSR